MVAMQLPQSVPAPHAIEMSSIVVLPRAASCRMAASFVARHWQTIMDECRSESVQAHAPVWCMNPYGTC